MSLINSTNGKILTYNIIYHSIVNAPYMVY